MLYIIQQILSELYDPMVMALNEIDILSQTISNGYLVFTLSELISMIISVSLFFMLIFTPIWLVARVIKRVVVK